ncbi:transposase [Spirosoma panaciterrae]|uniref:transposase n=1 Tax=Spirosoma panaciterrae TaxID=496058 RepID=UPI000367488E|nr:transposase [Spirosoma panaciterrae]
MDDTESEIYWLSGRAAVADGAAIHRSEAVKQLLHERPGRIHLERLPAYSPELNPVELFWSHRTAEAVEGQLEKSSVYQSR